jgi:Prealbumin-like fold domain
MSAGSSAEIDLGVVTTICQAGPSGSLEISACVAWSIPEADRECPVASVSGPNGFRAGTLPIGLTKCNCQPVVITTGSPPPQTGSITIVKTVVPTDPQDFSFTTTGSGLSNFILDDDSDGTLPNTRTFSGLVAGAYTVTEAATPGFDLTALTCTAGGSADIVTRTATITLATGANVTCTFTNAKISGGSIALQNGSFTLVNDALSGDFSIRNSSGGTQQVFVTSLAIVNATFRDGPNLVQATVTGCVYTPLPVAIPASGSQSIALSGCQVTPSVRKELMFTVRATINGGDQPFYERVYKVRTQ